MRLVSSCLTSIILISLFLPKNKALPRTPDETTVPSDALQISTPESMSAVQQETAGKKLQPEIIQTTTESAVNCFYRGWEDCPSSTEGSRCKRVGEDMSAAVCCNLNETTLQGELSFASELLTANVTKLHILNATLTDLNASLTGFRRLESLSITDGNIQRIVGEFPVKTPIQCLNISNNGITSIEQRALVPLVKLRKLDISRNDLTVLPNLKQSTNVSLDVSGNDKMPCQSLLKATHNYTYLDLENVNNTVCSISKSFQWFNTTELLPFEQVKEFFKIQHNCWPNCTCEFYRTDYVQGKLPTIAFKVDCSGKQLLEMPGELPKNTIVLNISNNNISVLKMDNESFGNIRELYADNNQIKSILSLEGTKFLDNFVALSLRNNKLKTLPMYMFSYIFDRNQNVRQVHFGLNKLHCDCNTAKNLKVSLLTKKTYIPDYKEIFCENSPQKVIELNEANMCQDNKQTWTDYIYYIITVEVLLLVCLVMKVSYDYWIFKTAGYLPWPANKMPKLPCDWLCE